MVDFPKLKIVGQEVLTDMQQLAVKDISSKYYEDIERDIKVLDGIKLHIKKGRSTKNEDSNSPGGRRYTLNLRVDSPHLRFTINTKTDGHDINEALHKTFDKAKRKILHITHKDHGIEKNIKVL